MPEAPIGKHLYGMVKVGEKGQIVIPGLTDHLITPADVGAHDRFVGICSMG